MLTELRAGFEAPAQSPLQRLRALKRAGFRDVEQLRQLLAELTSTLDLEAAGAMLSSKSGAGLGADPSLRKQRIALTGSSIFNALPNLLSALLVARGIVPEIALGGFNQWRFEMLSAEPSFAAQRPRIVACLLDDAAVFEAVSDPLDLEGVDAACEALPVELARFTEASQRAVGGTVVLSTLPLSPLRLGSLIDYRSKARLAAAFQRMNARILELSVQRERVVALDLAALGLRAGALFAAPRMRHATGQVYDAELLRAYAEELSRVATADLGLAKKCLVLDLDNTLWSGVVGDDGVAGIRLGGAYPGSAHQELQALARSLMRQGVMLTVASKNDDAIAREAIETHPEMLLRSDAFVAISANWEPKPTNVRAQALKLNIGLDAMVFLDDNPAERALMRAMLPEVETVELGTDPARYAEQLALRGDFNLLQLTDEDRQRTSMYRAREERAEHERGSDDLEGYLLSLESKLTLSALDDLNRGRIAQLFGKTNQFNMTGVRYSEDEVARLAREGHRFLCARLSDRFGDSGIIAALALAPLPGGAFEIESFVLSCRVFSRQVEQTLVALVLSAAREAGLSEVRARFVETPKNAKFRRFYEDLGFLPAEVGDASALVHRLEAMPEVPRWIQVVNDTEVFDAC